MPQKRGRAGGKVEAQEPRLFPADLLPMTGLPRAVAQTLPSLRLELLTDHRDAW